MGTRAQNGNQQLTPCTMDFYGLSNNNHYKSFKGNCTVITGNAVQEVSMGHILTSYFANSHI